MSMVETKDPVATAQALAPAAQLPALPQKMNTAGLAMQTMSGGAVFLPKSMQEAVDFATLMAKSGPAIPPAFRGQPGACLAVAMQAWRWEFDPFAVIQKAYVTTDKSGNDRIAYEAQLIAAVVNTRGPFVHRPIPEFEGEGENLRCTVTATIRGEPKPRTLRTPKIGGITVKNSPLWRSDPEQQLTYYALRAFGRRVCPEVLLGVYAPEDLTEMAPDNARDITPPPRPKLEDFVNKPKEPEPKPLTETEEREADRMTRAAMKGERRDAQAEDAGEAVMADEAAQEAEDTIETALERGMRLLATCATQAAVHDLHKTIMDELSEDADRDAWGDAVIARVQAVKGRRP